MRDVAAERLADCVRELRSGATIAIVGIDGYSAAGKSTLASKLAAELDGIVIAADDFYRVMDPIERARLTPWQGAAEYYDWQRLRRDVLEPLRAGRSTTFRRYDWDRNALAGPAVAIEPASWVILEGLFSTRPELADLLDIRVLVDTADDLRRERQLQRDDHPSWVERWDAAERWYFTHVRPPESFHLRVTG